MRKIRIQHPSGKVLVIDSPDGSIPNEGIIDQMFKQSGLDTKPESFGRGLYREFVSPIVAGSSSLALGIPREVARRRGVEELIYPEQKTLLGKGLRIGSEAVGLLGGAAAKGAKLASGLASRIPVMAGKKVLPSLARLGRNVAIGGAGAGTFGALQQPPEEKTRLGQAGEFAAIGGALPIAGAGLGKVGEVVTKTGRLIGKHIGGITDATVETIKRLGANRVFEPIKSQANYITENLAPRIYNKVLEFSNNANNAYRQAISSAPVGKQINIRPAIEEAGNILKKLGLVTNTGNLTELGKSEIARDSTYGKLLDFYKSADAISGVKRLQGQSLTQAQMIKASQASKETLANVDQFTFLRDKLNSLFRNKPSDIDVSKVVNKFYQAGEDSGIKGLQKARELSRKAFEIEDKLNPDKIAKDLIRAKNPRWTNIVRKDYQTLVDKGIISKEEYRNVFDDLMAHFANIDFGIVSETPGVGGGIYPSRAGLIRSGVGGLTKQYYKKVSPKIPQLQSGLKEALEKAISLQGKL